VKKATISGLASIGKAVCKLIAQLPAIWRNLFSLRIMLHAPIKSHWIINAPRNAECESLNCFNLDSSMSFSTYGKVYKLLLFHMRVKAIGCRKTISLICFSSGMIQAMQLSSILIQVNFTSRDSVLHNNCNAPATMWIPPAYSIPIWLVVCIVRVFLSQSAPIFDNFFRYQASELDKARTAWNATFCQQKSIP